MHILPPHLIVVVVCIVVIVMTIHRSSCIMLVLVLVLVRVMQHTVYAQTYLAIQGVGWMAVSIIAVCLVYTVCFEIVFEALLLGECLCGDDFRKSLEAGCL